MERERDRGLKQITIDFVELSLIYSIGIVKDKQDETEKDCLTRGT